MSLIILFAFACLQFSSTHAMATTPVEEQIRNTDGSAQQNPLSTKSRDRTSVNRSGSVTSMKSVATVRNKKYGKKLRDDLELTVDIFGCYKDLKDYVASDDHLTSIHEFIQKSSNKAKFLVCAIYNLDFPIVSLLVEYYNDDINYCIRWDWTTVSGSQSSSQHTLESWEKGVVGDPPAAHAVAHWIDLEMDKSQKRDHEKIKKIMFYLLYRSNHQSCEFAWDTLKVREEKISGPKYHDIKVNIKAIVDSATSGKRYVLPSANATGVLVSCGMELLSDRGSSANSLVFENSMMEETLLKLMLIKTELNTVYNDNDRLINHLQKEDRKLSTNEFIQQNRGKYLVNSIYNLDYNAVQLLLDEFGDDANFLVPFKPNRKLSDESACSIIHALHWWASLQTLSNDLKESNNKITKILLYLLPKINAKNTNKVLLLLLTEPFAKIRMKYSETMFRIQQLAEKNLRSAGVLSSVDISKSSSSNYLSSKKPFEAFNNSSTANKKKKGCCSVQ